MYLYYGLGCSLKKIMIKNKILNIVAIILLLSSCRGVDNMGFYQPITMDLKVPDGPPEFKAGWHAGCKSALANRGFQNSLFIKKNKGPITARAFINMILIFKPVGERLSLLASLILAVSLVCPQCNMHPSQNEIYFK